MSGAEELGINDRTFNQHQPTTPCQTARLHFNPNCVAQRSSMCKLALVSRLYVKSVLPPWVSLKDAVKDTPSLVFGVKDAVKDAPHLGLA